MRVPEKTREINERRDRKGDLDGEAERHKTLPLQFNETLPFLEERINRTDLNQSRPDSHLLREKEREIDYFRGIKIRG